MNDLGLDINRVQLDIAGGFIKSNDVSERERKNTLSIIQQLLIVSKMTSAGKREKKGSGRVVPPVDPFILLTRRLATSVSDIQVSRLLFSIRSSARAVNNLTFSWTSQWTKTRYWAKRCSLRLVEPCYACGNCSSRFCVYIGCTCTIKCPLMSHAGSLKKWP